METEKDQNESTLTKIRKSASLSLFKAWDEITGTARAFVGCLNSDLPKQGLNRLYKQMSRCLASKGGEVTARNNTIELGKIYLNLSEIGKKKFLTLLLEKFDVDYDKVRHSLNECQKDLNYENQQKLIKAITAPRRKILKQFSALSNGLKFIVDMRSDVLKFSKKSSELLKLESDLRVVLSSWFDIGLLDMQVITWRSPASLLEKLIEYEAVHQISSWSDLRNRLDSDRRCFAFFHYKMPNEPLIFLEVALHNKTATNIQSLLDQSAPVLKQEDVNTAVFYSISNSQQGLVGINLGNFLIKEVVAQLSHELTGIKTFVTLSPIPGFIKWLKENLADLRLTEEIKIEIGETIEGKKIDIEHLKQELLGLCAYYLLHEKKGNKACDSVANFHLTNGASIKQINWQADNSLKGQEESLGMMVNYHYELNKIDNNHENYISRGLISSTRAVGSLAKLLK